MRHLMAPMRLLAAFALVMTACGSSGSTGTVTADRSGDDAAASAADESSTEAAATAESTDNGDDETERAIDFRSPIAEFLGSDFTDREQTEAQMRELEQRAEQLTVECMRDLGFEYIPMDTSSFIVFAGEGEIEYGSDEWVETYGFGITTQRFPQSMVGPDLVGFDDEMMGGPFGEEPPPDPNQEYVDGLSPGARDAYYEALYGRPPDIDPTSMTEDEMNAAMRDFEPSGCSNIAREELFDSGGFGGPDPEFYETFGDEIESIYERVESDPRIVAATSAVSACVAEAGLDWSGDIDDLYDRFERDLNGLGNEMMDPFAGTDLNPAEMSQEEIDDFFASLPPPTLSDSEKALLGELQAEEIELAIAVRDCGGGPRDLEGLYNEVRIEYEQQFLDENADALAPFRAGG